MASLAGSSAQPVTQEPLMAQPNLQRNPFMLMIDPARVIAAMEKSERLSGLNRHVCRPLDRHLPVAAAGAAAQAAEADEAPDAGSEPPPLDA
jgi:hypothetical protein